MAYSRLRLEIKTIQRERLDRDRLEREKVLERVKKASRDLDGAREEIWSYSDNLFTERQTDGLTDRRTDICSS